jgi:hypothetical protein
LDDPGLIPCRDKRFAPVKNVQTGSGAHLPSGVVVTGDFSPGLEVYYFASI